VDCPKCLGKLQKTAITSRKTSEVKELQGAGLAFDLEVDKCFVCGGVWLDRGELDKYLSEEIEIVDSPSLGSKMDQELDAKHGNCPCCSIKMKKITSFKNTDLTVDTCSKCQGIWLDPAEIDILERANRPKQGFWKLLGKSFKRN